MGRPQVGGWQAVPRPPRHPPAGHCGTRDQPRVRGLVPPFQKHVALNFLPGPHNSGEQVLCKLVSAAVLTAPFQAGVLPSPAERLEGSPSPGSGAPGPLAGREGAALPVPGGVGAGPALLRAPFVRGGGGRLSLAQVTEAGRTHELQPAESPHSDPGGPLRTHARPGPLPAPRRGPRPALRPLRGNLGESRKPSGPPGSRPGPTPPPRARRRPALPVNHCSERRQRAKPGARQATRTKRKQRPGAGP